MTDQERFAVALSRTMSEGMQSIGTQKERLVHRTLKYYLEPDESRHEVPVGDYIADIFEPDTGHIWEIQSVGFDRLRGKLNAFLPEHPVTVILPVVRTKYLCWIRPDSGEVLTRRKSPRTGRATDILPEIYRLPQVQSHPHLRFCAALMDVEEYRLMDGWSKDGKRGSHRIERTPLSPPQLIFLSQPADYQAILPPLPESFTRKELAKALRLSPTKTGYAVTALERIGAITRIGSEGRAFLYARTALA